MKVNALIPVQLTVFVIVARTVVPAKRQQELQRLLYRKQHDTRTDDNLRFSCRTMHIVPGRSCFFWE